MKKIVTILFSMLIVGSVFAGPKYDAVYRLISKSYTFNEDGSMDYRFRKEIQLFTTASFDKYGETFITYNTELQTLTINEAYTIRPDSSRVETPKNAFNPSLPYGCTDCERFNPIREMVVTHTALELGATIVLDYTIHFTQPFFHELMERVNLYEDEPIDKYEVTVCLPQNLKLNAHLNYQGEKMTTSETNAQDGATTSQWTFTNLPARPADAYFPEDFLPYMSLMTITNPVEFVERIAFQNAFLETPTDPYKEVLNEILKDKTTDMAKVLAIRDYVADNIHTNKLPARYMNYILASPNTIWQTNCATAFEKNLLLKAMLRGAGFSSTFGVLTGNLLTDPESALRVSVNGEYYFITAAKKHYVSLENLNLSESFVSVTGNIYNFEKKPTKIEVSADVIVSRAEEGFSTEVRNLREKMSAASAKSLLLIEPAVAARVKLLSVGVHALGIYETPYGCKLQAAHIHRDRTLPVSVTPTEESYHYVVTLPAGVKCLSEPYRIMKEYDFGSLLIEMQINDNKVFIQRTLNIKKSSIAGKKQIRQLREMIGEWNVERPLIIQ